MDSSARRTDLRFAVGLAVLFVLVYLLPLGARPVGNPDEFRYGEIAREMLASGDWISPRLNGVRYFEKPILGHWTNAAALNYFNKSLDELTLDELRQFDPRLDYRVLAQLSVEASVASRRSAGGTAPERVRQAIAAARQQIAAREKE